MGKLQALLHPQPGIRHAIRASNPTNFASLLSRAIEAKRDEVELFRAPSKKDERKQPTAPAPAHNLPNCWYCPRRHFNKDCEVYQRNQAERSRQAERTHHEERYDPQSGKLEMGGGGSSHRPNLSLISLYLIHRDFRQLPRLMTYLNDHWLPGIIDTAATENFIRESYLTDQQLRSLQSDIDCVDLAALGITINILEKIVLPVIIRGHTMILDLLVCSELREPLILGLPWLEDQMIIIDIPGKRIYAGRDERYIIYFMQRPVGSDQSAAEPVNCNHNFSAEFEQHCYQKRYAVSAQSGPRFQADDLLWIRSYHLSDEGRGFNANMGPRGNGPEPITNNLGGEVYQVKLDGCLVTIHGRDIRPAPVRSELMDKSKIAKKNQSTLPIL